MRQRLRRTKLGRRLRPFRAVFRDTLLLLRQFFWPIVLFSLAVLACSLIYHAIAKESGETVGAAHISEAVYQVLGLTFFSPLGDNLPNDYRLKLFYFVMPVLGLMFLAMGIADFSILLFNRRKRSKEWEMAVASTFHNHIVLIGLGHLGFRVTKELHGLDLDVVVIELNPNEELVDYTKQSGIPVIPGDGRQESNLHAAGIAKARALVICTQHDSMNLQIAFTARKLNPDINIVVRIFDQDFGETLEEQFGYRAMSATGMSAPAFAAAAANVDITRPITVEGESFSLARIDIEPQSRLIGLSVEEVEQNYNVSVVLLRRNHESEFHPAGERCLCDTDVIAVLAGHHEISRLVDDNG